MKKTFVLKHPKKRYDRLIEEVKRDVKKYIKREQRKELTPGVDYWDFDCKYGKNADEAKSIHVAEINKSIDEIASLKIESFYLEILSKPGIRLKKEKEKEKEKEESN